MKLKKSLGQHLLVDQEVLSRIQSSLPDFEAYDKVIEIGPGRGALTAYVMKLKPQNYWLVELDDQFVVHLCKEFPSLKEKIIHKDILKLSLKAHCKFPSAIIGNFPYNISSAIIFKVLENREIIQSLVGMFQKEVAKRIAADHGNKSYGILSVLTQAFYDVKYLFDVPPEAFKPPPKVQSGVISMQRNKVTRLGCDEVLFKKVVKLAFQQRRKMIRNSIKQLVVKHDEGFQSEYLTLRPEQLAVSDFIVLTNQIDHYQKNG